MLLVLAPTTEAAALLEAAEAAAVDSTRDGVEDIKIIPPLSYFYLLTGRLRSEEPLFRRNWQASGRGFALPKKGS